MFMTATQVHQDTNYLLLPSFRKFVQNGGWYCDRCERIVLLGLDNESPARCPRCKHKTARWVPPVNLT